MLVFVAILFLAPLAIVALNVLEVMLWIYEKVVGLFRSHYASVLLKNDPKAYYRLGDASEATAADSSGNGHDARVKKQEAQ